jgi:hypothetical protein
LKLVPILLLSILAISCFAFLVPISKVASASGGAPTKDGTGTCQENQGTDFPASCTLSLTNSNSNDTMILICIGYQGINLVNDCTITNGTDSSPNLSWSLRIDSGSEYLQNICLNTLSGICYGDIQEYYSSWSGSGSLSISCAAQFSVFCYAIGVSGAGGFDSGSPYSEWCPYNCASSGDYKVTGITSHDPNDFFIGWAMDDVYGVVYTAAGNLGSNSMSNLYHNNYPDLGGKGEYYSASSTFSNTNMTFDSVSNEWFMIADVLIPSGTYSNTVSFVQKTSGAFGLNAGNYYTIDYNGGLSSLNCYSSTCSFYSNGTNSITSAASSDSSGTKRWEINSTSLSWANSQNVTFDFYAQWDITPKESGLASCGYCEYNTPFVYTSFGSSVTLGLTTSYQDAWMDNQSTWSLGFSNPYFYDLEYWTASPTSGSATHSYSQTITFTANSPVVSSSGYGNCASGIITLCAFQSYISLIGLNNFLGLIVLAISAALYLRSFNAWIPIAILGVSSSVFIFADNHGNVSSLLPNEVNVIFYGLLALAIGGTVYKIYTNRG